MEGKIFKKGDAVMVNSSVSYSLPKNQKNLTLTGKKAINGTGNARKNKIVGNSAKNHLKGQKGNDILTGGAGNDILDGGEGNDKLNGGEGNDIFVVDSVKDTLIERAKGGTDLVESSVSYNLPNNVENLTLTGKKAIDGTGNSQKNKIVGNNNTNYLQGKEGNDILTGGGGNDLLSGGKGNDNLNGGKGDDALVGGGGNDRLTGGEGRDLFVLHQTESPGNIQTILDFNPFFDAIGLSEGLTETDLYLTEESLGVELSSNTLIKLKKDGSTLAKVEGVSPAELGGKFLSSEKVRLTIPTFNSSFGYGLVDASAAVARALEQETFPDVPYRTDIAWGINSVKAPEVWAKGYWGQGMVVAVIDSGVDYNHPDLQNNIWINDDEIRDNGIDDDGNGYVDDVGGWDFIDDDNAPQDLEGHGTHIAGTVAAAGSIYGVAPGAKIMVLRTLDEDGSGKVSDGIEAIRYAADNGADVINFSSGGRQFVEAELDAIRYAESKGVVFVSAAGNENLTTPDFPAAAADRVGIAVGSVDFLNNFSSFSNQAGSEPLDYVVAPGGDGGVEDSGDILSTVPLFLGDNLYDYFAGTSMATPHVAGVAALVKQADPSLSVAEVESIIVETANPNVFI